MKVAGASFDIEGGVSSSARLLRAREKNQIAASVERLIREDSYARLLDAIEAEYGSDDMEKVADFGGAALEGGWSKKLLTLAGFLRERPDRLEADLMQLFGFTLDDLWEGRLSVLAVANAAAHLARGAVGEWCGGEVAVTREVAAVRENAHVLAQVQF